MNKFKFRLEPVLKHREVQEEQAAKEHARALEEYRQNNENLCAARERYAMAIQTYKPVNQFEYLNQITYTEYMTKEIKNLEAITSSSRRKFERCRENLVQAMMDRSIIEKLKEKQFRSYKLAANVLEQKENDGIATQLFLFRNK
ncbi:flagellar export protein FliJ [Desulfoscipio gibsoniae]|uniref:Flagellar FliJ protein n=1 Tax=Desulfoscipio gibsoniae DSM 7213 TaxID=767817 RepID=R4KMA0_9FIRM|nr:flagellar export protein FliJ [Desulfoscipio gibsoniae]AGL01655.1 flagellar export protein FliJ [Desulfoscipio gibsoniae DSM 7213]